MPKFAQHGNYDFVHRCDWHYSALLFGCSISLDVEGFFGCTAADSSVPGWAQFFGPIVVAGKVNTGNDKCQRSAPRPAFFRVSERLDALVLPRFKDDLGVALSTA